MTTNCAHRGASAHAPENTLAALELAVAQGAEMAEVDAQLSADGQVVLIHDETLDRTTSGSGTVASVSLELLRGLDAGAWFGEVWWGEKIPTLAEVLDAVGTRLTLNIELKGAAGPELEQAVVRLVNGAGLADRCLLTSFDHARIDRLASADHRFQLGYIIGQEAWRAELLAAPVQVLSVERRQVDAALVAAAHEVGKEVHVWTVNEEEEMRAMIGLGVDAVITNYPDRFTAVRGSQ